MDREQVREFLRRWRAVEAVEQRELRETPIEVKLQHLLAIRRLVRALGIPLARTANAQADEEEVRLRWQRLREALSRGGSR